MARALFSASLAGGIVFLLAQALAAQQPSTPQPIVHAPDAEVTSDPVQSIAISTKPNAPFTGFIVTTVTKILPDGSTVVTKNRRIVMRDSAGRVFQERRYLAPDGDIHGTAISQFQYDDPTRHERLLCNPEEGYCDAYSYSTPPPQPLQPTGILPSHRGTLAREDLGHKSTQGLDLIGTRETVTYAVHSRGNEKQEDVVRELWYSPALDVNISTMRFDPFVSMRQQFEVEGILLAEPDSKQVQPPRGFRIIKRY